MERHCSRFETKELLELAKFLYSYNSSTGILVWKNKKNAHSHITIGSEISHRDNNGYIRVHLGKRLYLGHRVAWALHFGEWPNGLIDHINGNRSDNRIENLRIVSDRENGWNKDIHRKGAIVGAFYDRKRGLWRSCININGKGIHLGRFSTQEEAHTAYINAYAEYKATGAVKVDKKFRKRDTYRNKNGIMGITQTKCGTWRSRIYFNSKRYCLGTYIEKEDAIQAYEQALVRIQEGDISCLK